MTRQPDPRCHDPFSFHADSDMKNCITNLSAVQKTKNFE